MNKRIYSVHNKSTGTWRLVLARSPAQTLRHITTAEFDISAASAVAVAKLMADGTRLEEAGDDDEDDTAEVEKAATPAGEAAPPAKAKSTASPSGIAAAAAKAAAAAV